MSFSQRPSVCFESCSRTRRSSALAAQLIAVPLILLSFYLPSYAPWLVLAYVVLAPAFSYRRVRAFALPSSYQRAFIAYCGFYLVGAAVFFGVIYIRRLPL